MGHRRSEGSSRRSSAPGEAARLKAATKSQAGQRESRPEQAEQEEDAWRRETGYRPSVNQMRDEPVPASHHAPHDQEAVPRSAQHATGKVKARPSRRARRRPSR